MNFDQAMMIMHAGRGSKFDPEILDAFFRVFEHERPEVKPQLGETEAVS